MRLNERSKRADIAARGRPGPPRRQTPRKVYFEEEETFAAPIAPRSAITTEEDLEEEAPRKKGLFGRAKEAREKAAKAKASKSFDRQYGGDDVPRPNEGAPRAAVYKAEMGSHHKRAARLQGAASRAAGAYSTRLSSASKPKEPAHPIRTRVLIALGAFLLCLVVAGFFLYEPTKLYYQEMRESQRLQIEYDALRQRNETIQGEVDALNSEEGVEDRAHQQFGWVKQDEKAVSVTGVTPSDPEYNANIAPGSIRPPDTWYSGILDPLFGVE